MSGALGRLLDRPEAATAVIRDDAGVEWTAQDLGAAADSLERRLRAGSLAPHEPVAVTVANRSADLAAFFGAWKAGGVVVPIHASAAEATMRTVMERTGARFHIIDGEIRRHADAPPPERPLLQDAALIIFTSGSTGEPKGVVIGHERLAAKLSVLRRLLRLAPADKVTLPLQLIFIFGIWVALLTLATGAQLRLVGKFTPPDMRALLPGTKVLACVPSMLRALFAGGDLAAPGLRAILTGGEALGPQLTAQLSRQLPSTGVYDLYGLTETGSCDFCLMPEDAAAGSNSIGRPTEGVAYRIANEPGQAGPSAQGELLIRTPYGMLGYLDNPDLTAAAYVDGYFRTGDVARLRPDGFVEIAGRIKEIISRGGNKIAPAEIEIVLSGHPAVSQALCAGVPDARLGETIHAAVVLKAGASATSEELKEWCRSRIERFKVPDVIHFVDSLPTGPTGKALRAGVRGLAEDRER